MGLAPYGEPVYLDAMHEIVRLLPKGRFELNLAYFNHHEDPVVYQFDGGQPVSPQMFSPKLDNEVFNCQKGSVAVRFHLWVDQEVLRRNEPFVLVVEAPFSSV